MGVLDRLDAGLLVGQEFMVPHQVDILNSSASISFGYFNGALVEASVFAKAPLKTYKVKAAATTVIPPHSHRVVPILRPKQEKTSPSCLGQSKKDGSTA